MIGRSAIFPPEPPATAFFDALLLFVEAFNDAGGFRLVRIARPPILFYGLYGNEPGDDENTLLQLTIQRGFLADTLDVFMRFDRSSGTFPDTLHSQIILDKILYDVDRAIDLYALGKERFGPPERRAAAYSYLIESFLKPVPALPHRLGTILTGIENILRPPLDLNHQGVAQVVNQLIALANNLGQNKAINSQLLTDLKSDVTTLGNLTHQSRFPVSTLTPVFKDIQQAILQLPGASRIPIPRETEEYLGIIGQELVIQLETEERWRILVETMATEVIPARSVFDAVPTIINNAIGELMGGHVEPLEFRIPPQFETSLEEIANRSRVLGHHG
jgi:hypothetical protein